MPSQVLITGDESAAWTIALAHGAGAGMHSPFMEAFAAGLAERGHRVARFEFPYMARRSAGEKGGRPDPEAGLRKSWLDVIARLGNRRLVVGGKSMGGRIASLVADEAGVAGLVCLGYPFHPVGKPAQLRVQHLKRLQTPTLIVQGERDPFGNRNDVGNYELSPTIRVHWLADGDHGFKPRKSSGRSEAQNRSEAVAEIDRFLASLEARLG